MTRQQTTVLDVSPCNVAVVLIDFQNAFCHPEAHTSDDNVGNRKTALAASDFARHAASLGAKVVYTQQILDPAFLSSGQREWAIAEGLCEKGSWQAELFVEPILGATVVTKYRYDIWQSPEFLQFVDGVRPEAFVFAGVELCCCVLYAVLGADERGFKYSVPMDLVSGIDSGAETYNRSVREFLRTVHDAPASAEDILKLWRHAQPGAGAEA